jgi:hypothetical protein
MRRSARIARWAGFPGVEQELGRDVNFVSSSPNPEKPELMSH